MRNIILLLVVFSTAAKSQSDTSFHLIKTIKADMVDFTVDNLDNIYMLNSSNQLKKLDANGDSVAVFNDVKKFGHATLIDVSNPLKILLYYRDFSTVIILDRFLNVRNTIDLRKQNIIQVKVNCPSYDNKIWLYDELENKLKKIDDDGKLLLETPDFRQLFDEAPNPQKIFDENKYVYLYDSSLAVFVFDYFGTLKNKIQITGWKNFKVSGKYIYGSNNDTLHRYEIGTFRLDEWKMPEEIYRSRSFNFTSSRLYALKKDRLEIYLFR
ncbi:MAG TPA: hypothetical protein VET23_01185 [Chitinophagaceae bacterium]|nr:hypothetical protein [Chitinophagaceae bacterium]